MKYMLAIIAGLVLTGAAFAVPILAQSATIGTGGVSAKAVGDACTLIGPDGGFVSGKITSESATKLVCKAVIPKQTHQTIYHGAFDPISCSDLAFGWTTTHWSSSSIETGHTILTCFNP